MAGEFRPCVPQLWCRRAVIRATQIPGAGAQPGRGHPMGSAAGIQRVPAVVVFRVAEAWRSLAGWCLTCPAFLTRCDRVTLCTV
jgi:hypothetical protein